MMFCNLSLLKYNKSEFRAEVKKLIARPDNNINRRDDLFLPARVNIKKAVNNEKIKANIKVPHIPLTKANKLKTLATVTPKAAPEDIPKRYGSVNGFLKRVWKIAPQIDRLIPTIMALIVLGILKFIIINLCDLEMLSLFAIIANISFNEIFTLPCVIDKKREIRPKRIAKMINILVLVKVFFINYFC